MFRKLGEVCVCVCVILAQDKEARVQEKARFGVLT